MSASLLMLASSLLFALMEVCVKLASAHYGAGAIVFYRSLDGVVSIFALTRLRGGPSLATPVPAMHFWRNASGVASLLLWFHSIAGLPLATAMTLNYMSSVWMALFLIGGSVLMGAARIDGRLVATVLAGFCGVALVLQPTVDRQQLWHALAGVLSGMLGRWPAFCIGGMAVGAASMALRGTATHTPAGLALLLTIGLLSTVAQMLMTRAYRGGRTLVNASLQYLGIAFAATFAAPWFDEPVGLVALAGIVLIVAAGLAATRLRERQQPQAPDSRMPPTES